MKSSPNSNSFYDQLAPLYRIKVDWESRSAKEDKLFDYLISTLKPTSVLDLGCGDGGHAPRYLTAGITYHGIDYSAEMIRVARQAYGQSEGSLFEVGDMSMLSAKLSARFDQILLLGNTLPHVSTLRTLRTTLAGIGRSLVAGGHFVVQTVNPGSLAGKRVHFLAAKLTTEAFFVPVYVRDGHYWEFYLTTHRLNAGSIESTTTSSTRLRIWNKRQVVENARRYGLKLISAYGGPQLQPYQSNKSGNMILIFRKVSRAGTA